MQQYIENIFEFIFPYRYYFALLFSIVFCRTPFVSNWFRIYDTLLHEFGHAFAALLFGGEIDSISLNYNISGKTNYSYKSKWTTFFVLLSGYTFSSAIGLLFLLSIVYNYVSFSFYAFLVIMIIALVLWVRNVFGILWLLINISILFLLQYYNLPKTTVFYLILVAFILMFESLYASAVVLKSIFSSKNNTDDASMLQKLTGISSAIWAIMFLGISLMCFGFAVYTVFIKPLHLNF